jgi:hypothetical protein
MDIIQQCLSLAPVPCLGSAFSTLKFIWSSIQTAEASKRQLRALTESIAQLLQTLDSEYQAERLLKVQTSTPLANLHRFAMLTLSWALGFDRFPSHRLLDEISAFVQKEALCGFLKLLFTKDQRIARIEAFHRRIGDAATAFQASVCR